VILDGKIAGNIKSLLILLLALIFLFQVVGPLYAAPSSDIVYVVPVEGMIDTGMVNFIERVYKEADELGIRNIILEIDTPGGLVNEAVRIKKIIDRSVTPTIAYVTGGAISAGALLALTSPELIMAPGTTMGAAEPRIGDEKADEKTVSYWASELAGAAEQNGRNPEIARAMADSDIAIPNLTEKGKLLTLTAKKALEHKMIDGILANRAEVLEFYGLSNTRVIEQEPAFTEQVSRWVTNPYVSSVLLTIGIAGIIIEIFTVGFGIPGIIGSLALALYFGGSLLVGLSGWGAILLFILGLILMALEAFVIPGFGVVGIAGLASLITSIFLAAPSSEQALTSLVLALIGTIVLVGLSIKILPTRKVWQRLILGTKLEKSSGYVASSPDYSGMEGKEGKALTPLRPAGVAEIDGLRVDVVTEGGFVQVSQPVKVIKVEGNKVVVTALKD
jgi:membrane-bound serine protease (ClpP class)